MKKNRGLIYGGILVYLILLFFSLFFYKERICFTDGAFHVYAILEHNGFAIQNHRFIAYFTQAFPLLLSRWHFSLAQLTMAYSASFVVLQLLLFLILSLGFKQNKLALLFLLFTVLMPRDSFYWCLSEIGQGVELFIVYCALLLNMFERGVRPGAYILAVFLLFIVALSHPLMLFGAAFVFLFFWFSRIDKRKIIFWQGSLFILFYGYKLFFLKTTNDSSATHNLFKHLYLLKDFFHVQANKNYLHYFIFDYTFITALLLIVLVFYARRRCWWKFAGVLSFFALYSIMVNISEPHGPDQFYVENRYLYLSLFVLFPFVFDVLPTFKQESLKHMLISGAVAISVFLIIHKHAYYTQRLYYIRTSFRVAEKNANAKMLVQQNDELFYALKMTWAYAYEAWLLSTIEKDTSFSILIQERENEFPQEALEQAKVFGTKFGFIPYEVLNPRYFKFTDTVSHYHLYPLSLTHE